MDPIQVSAREKDKPDKGLTPTKQESTPSNALFKLLNTQNPPANNYPAPQTFESYYMEVDQSKQNGSPQKQSPLKGTPQKGNLQSGNTQMGNP